MTRRPTALAVIALAALTAMTACSVPGQRRTRVVANDAVPFALLERDAPPLVPPPTAAQTDPVSLCLIQGSGLVVVEARLDSPVLLGDAVAALARPPATAGQARTALTDAAIVRDVQLVAGLARVDFREGISTLGGDDQLLVVAQIVCTLTSRPGIGQVSFTLEGSPIEVPRGDGSVVAAPVSRDDYAGLLP